MTNPKKGMDSLQISNNPTKSSLHLDQKDDQGKKNTTSGN